MPESRLVRSETDRLLAGVCGGIAAYLNIDPVFVRLGFLLLIPSGGVGIPLYLALMIAMPAAGSTADTPAAVAQANIAELGDALHTALVRLGRAARPQPVATAVILLGAYLLLRNLTGFVLDLRLVGPLLLVGAGVYLLFGRSGES